MLLVLALTAVLWALGWYLGAPKVQRWVMIGVLVGAVILAHLVLPEGNGLRQATGGSAAPWVILVVLGGIVALYRRGLGVLRRKAQGAPVTASGGPFAEGELARYARHIVLREIGGPGQRKLKQARILVIGAGGLGSPAIQYLAAAGVGTIGVIDGDTVDATNLQRQVIHTESQVGMPKVFSAAEAVAGLNAHMEVRPYHRELTEEIAGELFAGFDVILDGTDNFETRYLANRAAVAAGKPLVSGALSQWEGQLSVFDPASGAPCYQCVFAEPPAPGLAPSCAEAGVLGPLPGVVGSMMAVEAVKLVTGAGETMRGRMLIYDALYGETRTIALKRRPECPICGEATRKAG